MENSKLINFQVLFENILGKVYEVPVDVHLKLRSKSCGRNMNLSDYVLATILIKFEVLPQNFNFYLQVSNMVNIVLHSYKLLAIFNLGSFSVISQQYNPLDFYLF